jgi:uncharacterized protein (TIGR03435 family)
MLVVDQTGLTGHYDFTLDLSPYITPDSKRNADMYTIAAQAFLEDVGLKVKPGSCRSEMLIMDRVESAHS